MRKKALRKDFYMEIRKSFGRFLSIFFIVAIGTAFFSGIRAAEPDMRLSGDAYFDQSKLMDLQVISTMGLTADDLQAIHINQYLSPEHMRQVCAHEIGHAIMHPLDNTTFIRANTLFMPSKCELEANQFMACLLYDIDEVIQQAKNGITISQLATAYDIRPEYMEYVLRSHQSEENQCL